MSNTSERIENLSPKKRALLLQQLRSQAGRSTPTRIERQPRDGAPLLLSFAQQRMWLVNQYEPGTPVDNIPARFRLTGSLDRLALKRVLGEIVRRHEALRTTFSLIDGQPYQIIAPAGPVALPLLDLAGLADGAHAAQRLAVALARRPFELAEGPLLRAILLRLSAQEHWLLLTMHHIISDGWSMGVLFRELGALYAAFVADQPSPLPEPGIQYADFAHWQRGWLIAASANQPAPLQTQLAYWQAQLAGAPPVLALPADRPRPTAQTYRGRLHTFMLPAALTLHLKALSRQADATLFMTLLAAFKLLLYRYTGQHDIVVGSPIANRNHVDTEALIGFFVNMLVLRTRLTGGIAFRELLAQVRDVTLGAYAHQDLPFEKLVEELRPERQPDRPPLVQIVFALQNAPLPPLQLGDLALDFGFVHTGTAKTDVSLSLTEAGDALRGELEYNTDLFDESRLRRLARHFQQLLAGIVVAPDQRIADLPLLTSAEQQQLLIDWNDTAAGVGGQGSGVGSFRADASCMHQLFEAQARRTPDAIALVFDRGQGSGVRDQESPAFSVQPSAFSVHMTYAELNQRANQLAWHLRALDVGLEAHVGICLDRSIALVVGLLGVLKAGGAYLPLDPAYPQERLAFMLDDAQVAVLLTATKDEGRRTKDEETQPQSLHDLGLTINVMRASPPAIQNRVPRRGESKIQNPTPDNLAYIIYTSGSTGQPKGVLVAQRAVVNHCLAVAARYDLSAADRALQCAAASFDVAAEELFPALSRGATVVLRPPDLLDSFVGFAAFVERTHLTVLNLPASFWHAWVLDLALSKAISRSVRLVIVGNEPVSLERLALWRERVGTRVRWLNAYGPTEATITATLHAPDERATQSVARYVPIGRPISNVQLYLLDAQLRPVAIGVPGELYIGGAGVARGYLNRPDLTAERFVPNPFVGDKETRRQGDKETPQSAICNLQSAICNRLYRTGDLARYQPDGTLEFLGRADDQVQLRGYRVEPGEIEAVLKQDPSVREATVVAHADAVNGPQLVAYVVPTNDDRRGTIYRAPTTDDEADSSTVHRPSSIVQELRDHLAQRLPDYMLPSAFVLLDALPRLPNGKLDRDVLPRPNGAGVPLTTRVAAPRSPIEAAIVDIWADVLNRRVGIHDNFFELGGHSLLATQVTSRVQQVFRVELPLRAFFELPTVAGLAQRVEQALATTLIAGPSLRPIPRVGVLPLSYAQQRLWFLEQLEPGTPVYNLPTTIGLTLALDVAALAGSLNEIIRRHEALRTTFSAIAGRPQQLIAQHLTLALPVVDLQALAATERAEQALRLASEVAWQPFDLARGPLLRALLLKLGRQEQILLLTMHHIISDGWSIEVLVNELAILYTAFAAGQPASLPKLPIQYADFAHWQRQWLQGATFEHALAYWRRSLADAAPALDLPFDRPRSSQSHRVAYQALPLATDLSAAVKALSRHLGVTPFMSLLAAFQTLLFRYTDQADISVGTYIANRNRAEVEALIGYFVNTLVLRTRFDARDLCFRDLLAQVRDVTLGAYAHQDLPFEKLLEALRPERVLDRTPLFQVAFVLQNVPPASPQLPGLSLHPLEIVGKRAHFDITLWMIDTGDQLVGSLEYNADLFEPATIAGLVRCFQTLLAGSVAAPETPLTRLPLLSPSERQQLLASLTPLHAAAADAPLLPHALVAQAAASPDAIAIVGDDAQLSYAALLAHACQLAQLLHARRLGPDDRVGLLLARSPALVIATLATLLAGAAYVPLDPLAPAARLAALLANAQPRLILTLSAHQDALATALPLPPAWLCLDQAWPTLAALPPMPPALTLLPDQLAYLIYTSGSTGTPKGVLVPHESLRAYLSAIAPHLRLRPEDRVLQFAAPSFDATVEETFPVWLVGATVVLRPSTLRLPDETFAALLVRERLSVLSLPVPFWHAWVDELSRTHAALPADLRLLLLNADAPDADRYARWQQLAGSAAVRWVNTYGPTEATVTATLYEPTTDAERERAWQRLPIGTALAHTPALVLDRQRELVPLGVVGELYLAGAGVTRGYHARPDLTAERFVPNPFAGDKETGRQGDKENSNRPSSIVYRPSSDRLYNTGDLVRWRADGQLEFLGRRDRQVKVRGYRVELGEIEAALRQHPAVREAVAILQADRAVGQRLIAYVVQGSGVETARRAVSTPDPRPLIPDLRLFLATRLPDYMQPSAFVPLDELPRTPNGKIDRRALATRAADPEQRKAFVAPRTTIETVVRGIWLEVLQAERVSIYDDFFALGGDPLLASRVIARLNDALQIALPLRSLYETPTIAGLADTIEALRWAARSQRDARSLVPSDHEELEL